jgi:trehalose 6-phosphate synthase
MSQLIIASNRGPVSFSEKYLKNAQASLDKGTKPRAQEFGAGGLVQAMAGLLKPGRWKTTWLGASMGDRDMDVARGHYSRLFKEMTAAGYSPDHFPHIEIGPDRRMRFRYGEYDFHMRFVLFDTRHMYSYYNKFANGFLWPLMHLTRSPLFYRRTRTFPRPEFNNSDFVQYTSSGVTFANTIYDEVRKRSGRQQDDLVVWSQDYHLMRIAEVYKGLLVEEGVSAEERERIHVGQFMHTPFFDIHEIQGLIREDKRARVKAQVLDPFSDCIESALQKLTWGLLANDFIGFHTKQYCDNYLEALQEWFPVDIKVSGESYEIRRQGLVTTVAALPIGLDVDRILSEVTARKRLKHRLRGEPLSVELERDRSAGRTIFGGLERCDYTKGLVERLGIFYHALGRLRDSGEDARLYQVTAPSRSGNPDYRRLNTVLEQEVQRLNAELEGRPITHIDEGIPAPDNYRFMKEIDVMLVTPLDDGMNLVAFEYILSQKPKRPDDRGLLALSTSGASRVLRQQGFGEKDGIVFVNPMRPKDGAERTVRALRAGRRLSDRVIGYVEKERQVDDWAARNIEAILNARKSA